MLIATRARVHQGSQCGQLHRREVLEHGKDWITPVTSATVSPALAAACRSCAHGSAGKWVAVEPGNVKLMHSRASIFLFSYTGHKTQTCTQALPGCEGKQRQRCMRVQMAGTSTLAEQSGFLSLVRVPHHMVAADSRRDGQLEVWRLRAQGALAPCVCSAPARWCPICAVHNAPPCRSALYRNRLPRPSNMARHCLCGWRMCVSGGGRARNKQATGLQALALLIKSLVT